MTIPALGRTVWFYTGSQKWRFSCQGCRTFLTVWGWVRVAKKVVRKYERRVSPERRKAVALAMKELFRKHPKKETASGLGRNVNTIWFGRVRRKLKRRQRSDFLSVLTVWGPIPLWDGRCSAYYPGEVPKYKSVCVQPLWPKRRYQCVTKMAAKLTMATR